MNLRLFLSILFIYIGTYSYTQQLKLDKGPEDYQLFARDKNDKATVLFSGSVTDDAKFNELRLKVYKDGVLYDNKSVKIENREFKFSSIIQAGLFQYRFELYHQIESVEKLSFIADNVVCGDAYIITGQSNSHASSNKSSYTVICESDLNGSINIKKGEARGVEQVACGYLNNEVVIEMQFKAAIGEARSFDKIEVDGIPSFVSEIEGGINGDIATCSIAINSVKSILKANPGFHTMSDIVVPGYIN